MSGDEWTIINIRPPEGEWYCDLCNAVCGRQNIAVQRCVLTSWQSLYCGGCETEYKKGGFKPSDFVATYEKGQEIKILEGGA